MFFGGDFILFFVHFFVNFNSYDTGCMLERKPAFLLKLLPRQIFFLVLCLVDLKNMSEGIRCVSDVHPQCLKFEVLLIVVN